MNCVTFDLVSEHNRPVAAILPQPVTGAQSRVIYQLLPREATFQEALASRWNVSAVYAPPAWAKAQLARVPMTRPKGHTLDLIETASAL